MDRTEAFNWTAELSANLFASEEAQSPVWGIPQSANQRPGFRRTDLHTRLSETPAVLPFRAKLAKKGNTAGFAEGHTRRLGASRCELGTVSALCLSDVGNRWGVDPGIDCGGSGIKARCSMPKARWLPSAFGIKTSLPASAGTIRA